MCRVADARLGSAFPHESHAVARHPFGTVCTRAPVRRVQRFAAWGGVGRVEGQREVGGAWEKDAKATDGRAVFVCGNRVRNQAMFTPHPW